MSTHPHPSRPQPSPGSARWYLIQSRPQQAQRAEDNLARQGYQVYYPRYPIERIRRGRRCTSEAALFPNYLFICLDRWSDNWYPIRSTRGVARLVRFGTEPLPVPHGLIDAIRQRIEHRQVTPAYQPGDRVEITDGPFRGLEAIFRAQRDDERVILLIELLHRQLEVTASAGSIRRSA